MNNDGLRALYDKWYKDGIMNYWSLEDRSDFDAVIGMIDEWSGLNVLEIGCGEGQLAIKIAEKNAEVTAVDYSTEAIKKANELVGNASLNNIHFECMDYKELPKHKYDVVVMNGVLEHMDSPFEMLDFICLNFLGSGGRIVTSSPNFINLRGYVWMTLTLLFEVPMSLSDLHFLAPWQFEDYCTERKYMLNMSSCQLSWGGGDVMISDLKGRLPNALKDANMSTDHIQDLIDWLNRAKDYVPGNELSGAMMVYKIEVV